MIRAHEHTRGQRRNRKEPAPGEVYRGRCRTFGIRPAAGCPNFHAAVVVSHVRAPGPSVHLLSYLTAKYDVVLEIEHPLEHGRPAMSTWRLWRGNRIIANGASSHSLPEMLRYVLDVMLTVWWTFKTVRKADVLIGLGALSGLAGIITRTLGCTESTVTWLIDYSPRRFRSSLLNWIFHIADTTAALRSNETWNISNKVVDVHQPTAWALRLRRPSNIQRVVPIGIDRTVDPSCPRRHSELIFIGHVLEKQGLQLVVDALPQLLKTLPELHLVVLGDGPYLPNLRQRAAELGVEASVTFTGLVLSDDEVWTALSQASIGVATYLNLHDSFTNYADPGKIKQYLAAGLPICMTGVPAIATEVEQRYCGLVAEDNADSVAMTIRALLNDPGLPDRRRACVAFASEFTWDRIWCRAFDGLTYYESAE